MDYTAGQLGNKLDFTSGLNKVLNPNKEDLSLPHSPSINSFSYAKRAASNLYIVKKTVRYVYMYLTVCGY